MNEEFVFAVLADDDKSIVHRGAESLVQSKIQRIRESFLLVARNFCAGT